MKKITFLNILIILAIVLPAKLLAQKTTGNTNKQKPNILFIVVDDLKPLLGTYENSGIKSPGIDKLASQGVVFENAYCQQAVCAPSRVSFFTGKRPDKTKVWDLKTHMRDMNPDIITMPQFFKQNGYTSVGFGKLLHGAKGNDRVSWNITSKDEKLNYAEGYSYPASGKYQNPQIIKLVKEAQEQKLNWRQTKNMLQKNDLMPSVECLDVPDDAYTDGAIAEKGMKLMSRLSKKEKPFFMALGFRKPHLPFSVPKKYWDMYDRDEITINSFQEQSENSPKYAYHTWGELRAYSDIPNDEYLSESKQKELIHGYKASVSYVDAQIEKLLQKLEDLGIENNTIVVLIGDHGWHLGDHALWCKHSNFEQATKVPFIIKAPGYSKAKRASTMAELIDVFPTLAEYANLKIPEYLDGQSLVSVLENPEKQVKDYAISQYPRGKNVMGYTIRTKQYRLTLWIKGDFSEGLSYDNPEIVASELYDYKNDPLEKVSQANNKEYAKVVKELKSKLLKLLSEQASKF